MQNEIRAKTLVSIAIAVALLAASVILLSDVDPAKLAAALAAITTMFGQLLGAMYVFEKIPVSENVF
jgi:predicted RNA methylase